jgi:UDP-N-acetylmuramoylalanine--D-glutamate ligase
MLRERLIAQLKLRFGYDPQASRLLVVGLGATGVSVARFLQRLDLPFAIADSRDNLSGLDELRSALPDVRVDTGAFDAEYFADFTHLIVSPGISLQEAAIRHAVASGAHVLGDIDLFALGTDKPIIAITGSNGKSTVTTMMGELGTAAGVRTAVGGNLGTAALDLLDDDVAVYALELSSFQLERTTALNAAAAALLNLSPDHLDRHADMAEYTLQKQRIFRGDGAMILNIDDHAVAAMAESERRIFAFSVAGPADFHYSDGQLLYREQPLMAAAELPLEGLHNVANALAALALGHALGWPLAEMCQALRRFEGLPHRMQRVAEVGGVRWINDSKATNIGACAAALAGYRDKVVLIAGGDAKGANMMELAPLLQSKTKAVVLIGKDAQLIDQAIAGSVPTAHATDMQHAVQCAARFAHAGDSVLLSPACASLDQYKSYADRGNQFAQAVRELSA